VFLLEFSARREEKRNGREIEGGIRARRRTLRGLATRKWRRKPLKWLKTDTEMAPGCSRSRG